MGARDAGGPSTGGNGGRTGAVVLAAAIVAVAVGLVVAFVVFVVLDDGWTRVIWVVVGTFLLWQVVPRPERPNARAVAVSAQEAPALHALVTEVASAVGAGRPQSVVVDTLYATSLVPVGYRGRAALVLGLPQWTALETTSASRPWPTPWRASNRRADRPASWSGSPTTCSPGWCCCSPRPRRCSRTRRRASSTTAGWAHWEPATGSRATGCAGRSRPRWAPPGSRSWHRRPGSSRGPAPGRPAHQHPRMPARRSRGRCARRVTHRGRPAAQHAAGAEGVGGRRGRGPAPRRPVRCDGAGRAPGVRRAGPTAGRRDDHGGASGPRSRADRRPRRGTPAARGGHPCGGAGRGPGRRPRPRPVPRSARPALRGGAGPRPFVTFVPPRVGNVDAVSTRHPATDLRRRRPSRLADGHDAGDRRIWPPRRPLAAWSG